MPEKTVETTKSLRFYVNMRILADHFLEQGFDIELYNDSIENHLTDVKLLRKGGKTPDGYAYIADAALFSELKQSVSDLPLILTEPVVPDEIPENCITILFRTKIGTGEVMDLVQEIFSMYRDWDWKIHQVLMNKNPLDDILLASMEIFRNPMFIHDNHFYILSDPAHSPEMSSWEKDKRTGKDIVSMALINDFRTDYEYLDGLRSHKPVIYSSNQTGYRILYRNLWNGGHYVGRILVDELKTPIQPGQFYVIDYLGSVFEQYISSRQLIWLSIGNELDQMLTDAIATGKIDERIATAQLEFLHWGLTDTYVVMKVVAEQQEFSTISAYATIGQIEMQVPYCKAFYYENSISVVVNLTRGQESAADAVRRLAIIMRESLLKIGISSEVKGFRLVPTAFREASIALDFGRSSGSMYWYYYFDDYKLEYIVHCAGKEIPARMLCADALERLRQYDQENKTDLYNTLKVYLTLEKNVLQTSKELFIHRSTLAYRLEKIQKIISVDLGNPKERLKLLMSYYIEEGLQ